MLQESSTVTSVTIVTRIKKKIKILPRLFETTHRHEVSKGHQCSFDAGRSRLCRRDVSCFINGFLPVGLEHQRVVPLLKDAKLLDKVSQHLMPLISYIYLHKVSLILKGHSAFFGSSEMMLIFTMMNEPDITEGSAAL